MPNRYHGTVQFLFFRSPRPEWTWDRLAPKGNREKPWGEGCVPAPVLRISISATIILIVWSSLEVGAKKACIILCLRERAALKFPKQCTVHWFLIFPPISKAIIPSLWPRRFVRCSWCQRLCVFFRWTVAEEQWTWTVKLLFIFWFCFSCSLYQHQSNAHVFHPFWRHVKK